MELTKRLMHALLSRSGDKLENVKFFLGSDRNITQEEVCTETANALAQIAHGLAAPSESLDHGIAKKSIGEFIG